MLRIGFIGWRGMVGSVLMDRMREEQDFKDFEAFFYTTSNIGGKGPEVGLDIPPLRDAHDIGLLTDLDIIVTCQGGGYSKSVYPELRKTGWKGYWIDSSSALRMNDAPPAVPPSEALAAIERSDFNASTAARNLEALYLEEPPPRNS